MAIAIETVQAIDEKFAVMSTRYPYLISEDGIDTWSKEEITELFARATAQDSFEAAILYHSLNQNINSCAEIFLNGQIDTEFLINEGPHLNLAERASNGLKAALFETSYYGAITQRIRDSETYKDHNHSHEGRVERHIEAGVLLSPELPITDRRVYYALMLFPDNHDAIQLDAFEINENVMSGEQKINVKQGHGEAGALRMRALTKLYADENLMPYEQANIITGISAIQIAYHERADKIHEVFQGTVDAQDFNAEKARLIELFATDKKTFYENLAQSELLKAYKTNRLDPYTLSSQDIALIAIASRIVPELTEEELAKGKSKQREFLTDETPFGLHPEFEREFGSELMEQLHDNNRFFDFSGMSDEQIASFKTSVEIATNQAIMADTHDWVMPADLANARTFSGSKSLLRPFIKGSTKSIVWSIQNEGVHGQIDSDVRRKLFEFDNMDIQLENSPLRESKYIQRLIYSCQIAAINSFTDAGNVIMTGDESLIRAYYARIIGEERKNLENKLTKKGQSLDHPLLQSLDEEVDSIIASLNSTGKIRPYSKKEKRTFNKTCKAIKNGILKRHKSKEIVAVAFQLPYGSYFSTSPDIKKIKTIKQHQFQQTA